MEIIAPIFGYLFEAGVPVMDLVFAGSARVSISCLAL